MSKLSPKQYKVAALTSEGFGVSAIALQVGSSQQVVRNTLQVLYRKLEIDATITRRVQLAMYWNCELFQIGLRELGLMS